MCGSRAQLTCSILLDLPFSVICICIKFQIHSKPLFTIICITISFIWKATFHAVLCICMWIMHITICTVGLQWYKMNSKWPEHPSSSLPTTAAERSQVSTSSYFFACLVFSPHDMNVFVKDLTVEYAMTHVQGFSSGILIILFVKLCQIWRKLD